MFNSYIKKVRQSGKQYFTTQDALRELTISKDAFYAGIYRLKKKGDIVTPTQGLYVIVPPENFNIGCIPAEELVPIVMQDTPYYAALLTAALYHGASHQKPQVFQVMTNRRMSSVICGKIKIDFVYKKNMNTLPLDRLTVKSGYLSISNPELTIYDLLCYPTVSGGLNNIATILSELIESIDLKRLKQFTDGQNQQVWVQRLGYILEHVETFHEDKKEQVIQLLEAYLQEMPRRFAPLDPKTPDNGCPRNKRWHIIENRTIESD